MLNYKMQDAKPQDMGQVVVQQGPDTAAAAMFIHWLELHTS